MATSLFGVFAKTRPSASVVNAQHRDGKSTPLSQQGRPRKATEKHPSKEWSSVPLQILAEKKRANDEIRDLTR